MIDLMLEIGSYIIVERNKDQKEVKIDLAYLHGSGFFWSRREIQAIGEFRTKYIDQLWSLLSFFLYNTEFKLYWSAAFSPFRYAWSQIGVIKVEED